MSFGAISPGLATLIIVAMNILLVEDDIQMADHLARAFSAEGYRMDVERNGDTGLSRAVSGDYDVIVLDRMLPGIDGLTLLKSLRDDQILTPVICLTTMCGVHHRVEGLEAGADDYLVKPFAFTELLARVRALARRPALQRTLLVVGDLKMDLIQRSVMRGNQPIELLPQEFKLLEYFMRNQGRTVTRYMILENVWDIHFDPRTSVVESHISRLRAKISPGATRDYIRTVRNAGYILNAPF